MPHPHDHSTHLVSPQAFGDPTRAPGTATPPEPTTQGITPPPLDIEVDQRDTAVLNAYASTHTVTIEGITLCTDEPLTPDEQTAIAAYFRLLRMERDRKRGIQDLDH
jgi:hypothetical protein